MTQKPGTAFLLHLFRSWGLQALLSSSMSSGYGGVRSRLILFILTRDLIYCLAAWKTFYNLWFPENFLKCELSVDHSESIFLGKPFLKHYGSMLHIPFCFSASLAALRFTPHKLYIMTCTVWWFDTCRNPENHRHHQDRYIVITPKVSLFLL